MDEEDEACGVYLMSLENMSEVHAASPTCLKFNILFLLTLLSLQYYALKDKAISQLVTLYIGYSALHNAWHVRRNNLKHTAVQIQVSSLQWGWLQSSNLMESGVE
ncbi:hypothetical protein F4604DRAFT_1674502 [Suillus subluteus]|nr:hypothetical protein F4604DRAFT_1674502 [Suillus subluteus]